MTQGWALRPDVQATEAWASLGHLRTVGQQLTAIDTCVIGGALASSSHGDASRRGPAMARLARDDPLACDGPLSSQALALDQRQV